MNLEEAIKTTSPLNPFTKSVLNIMYTNKLVEEKIHHYLKPYGISAQQYNVLRILRGQKGNPASLNCIQERMISKMSNTTRLVDKLILKGYVERSICEVNRRKVEITITSMGLQLLEQLDPISTQGNQEILKEFSIQDLDKLNILLDKLKS